jgi:hypothetical protein
MLCIVCIAIELLNTVLKRQFCVLYQNFNQYSVVV